MTGFKFVKLSLASGIFYVFRSQSKSLWRPVGIFSQPEVALDHVPGTSFFPYITTESFQIYLPASYFFCLFRKSESPITYRFTCWYMMDKTLPINIQLNSSQLHNIFIMLSCINFGPSVFPVAVTMSELFFLCFGTVPQRDLDTVLPLLADGYSSWSQAQLRQCGLKPAVQSHHSSQFSCQSQLDLLWIKYSNFWEPSVVAFWLFLVVGIAGKNAFLYSPVQ